MCYPEIVAAIITALPATAIAVFVALINKEQAKLDKRKAQRELFEKFNERFDKLNDILNDIAANKSLIELSKIEERTVQDYLNLCSEEYFCYTRQLIDKDIWKSWQVGIDNYLKTKSISELFLRERTKSAESYYNFFSTLNSLHSL